MAIGCVKITYQQIKALYGIENSKTDEDYQKEFSKYFFYANVCQHCTSSQKPVSICGKCYTTCYCSEDHRQIHREDHHEAFCDVLKKVTIDENKSYIFQGCCMSVMEKKTYFTEKTELELGRRLKPYEQNIFLYPRICLFCTEADPDKLLVSCPNCQHVNFCIEHQDVQHRKYHDKCTCALFDEVFFMDQHWLVFKDLPLEKFVHALPHNERKINLPGSLLWFLVKYVMPHHNNMNLEGKEVRKIVSTVFHRTLTLIYALEQLNLLFSTNLEVHIICKRKFVQENFVEWEILLHWLPRLKNLKICFIGCQMPQQTFKMRLCAHCKGKTLEIEISNLCCKEYYGNSSHRNANVIMSYDVDTNTHRTWYGASSLFTSMKIPIVLTSLDREHLREAVTMCVKNPEQFKQILENPYKSLKEEKFLLSISHSSHFISIYPNLSPKICGVDNAINPCHKCDDCISYKNLKLLRVQIIKDYKKLNKCLKNTLTRYQQAIEKLKKFYNKIDYARSAIENIKQDLEKANSEIVEDIKTFKALLKPKDDKDTTT